MRDVMKISGFPALPKKFLKEPLNSNNMTGMLSREDIIQELNMVKKDLVSFCQGINNQSFFQQPLDKWSIAQNIKHLIISTERTKLLFSLPKFIIGYYIGKPNRSSRTYDELVAK